MIDQSSPLRSKVAAIKELRQLGHPDVIDLDTAKRFIERVMELGGRDALAHQKVMTHIAIQLPGVKELRDTEPVNPFGPGRMAPTYQTSGGSI